ncbi:Trp biosynthesis-associated membrane protein [Nonomuraea soli]|uniref:Trp biosynthesis-associated membrane protein n=1 Tax=Nonomuraea soli TaxID=1032476 RepID=A0A7W0CEM3_9ACTN|nr:Trp biosynthesis-associated membrane protein [Nonomuraea soli]MBA2889770.1 hypothetical protein [Nonomuraea soli]
MKREMWLWLGVTALGAVAVLLAAGREWGAASDPAGAPALTPPALAALAGVVAVLAAKGLGRRIVGGLIALCGVITVIAAWGPFGTVWPYVAIGGGLLVLLGGIATVVRGVRWQAMSERYGRDRPRTEDGDRSMWDALDRGEDPTS